MYDENGQKFARRQWDGWKILPMAIAPMIALFAWGVSVETRLTNILAVQADRTPKIAKIQEDLADLAIKVYDPSMKPEAAKAFKQVWEDHDRLSSRIDRIEERFNNFHQFLLQTRPSVFPPGRRGEGPFVPEPVDDEGSGRKGRG